MKIVCKLSEDDTYMVSDCKYININNSKDFWYKFWDTKNVFPAFYQHEALDMLYLSLFVFGADRLILRDSAKDAWSRDIELHVPVLAYEKWINLKSSVENMLNFLTGDHWIIDFRPRGYVDTEIKARKRWERVKDYNNDISKVCMLSGGLDSCIGAIDLLSLQENKKEILFVSHYGGGKGTKEYQDALKREFIRSYGVREGQIIQNHASVMDGEEDTTRSRSFMFFAHAIAYASAMNKSIELIIPENGLISLNIPLAHTRLGSSSTRTTHPYYMKMLQRLIWDLGLDISIINPYQFKTKGEMILECKNRDFLQAILKHTMSCSHPDNGRNRGMKYTMHCGYCLPCTIRKAAILRGNLEDTSKYYDNSYSLLLVSKQAVRTYRYALANFNENTAFLKIQSSGQISEKVEEYADLYVRGMKELKQYLESVNV